MNIQDYEYKKSDGTHKTNDPVISAFRAMLNYGAEF